MNVLRCIPLGRLLPVFRATQFRVFGLVPIGPPLPPKLGQCPATGPLYAAPESLVFAATNVWQVKPLDSRTQLLLLPAPSLLLPPSPTALGFLNGSNVRLSSR